MQDSKAMIVQVQVKQVYGGTAVYPYYAAPIALTFARLVGQKTFTHHALTLIEKLGYEIKQVHEEVEL